jgi:plastocyanin
MPPTHRLALALLVVLASANAAPRALAGVIHGTIRTPTPAAPAPTMNAYPGRANAMAGGMMPVHGRAADAVVYIVRIPAEAESALARTPEPRPQLAQKDEAFVPRVVVVACGGSVDFPNRDPIFHNVFSLSPTRRFDLGKYRQGHSKSVRFDRTGLVKVYCDIHSEMEAFVLVVANRAYALSGADGSYQLPDLPAGRYELRAWHPDLPELTRTVEVPDHGDVRLDLSF